MKAMIKFVGAVALLGLVVSGGARQDKVLLVMKAEVGQVARYQLDLDIAIEFSGQKFSTSVRQVDKGTVKAVTPEGHITVEREMESQEVRVNGEKVEDEERSDKPSKVTVAPDGTLVSYESGDEPDETYLNQRLFAATTVIFSKSPVGVGDKWSYTYTDDKKLLTHAGKADFEVLAFEKVKGIDCVKIKMSFEESAGSPRFGANSTLWVESVSGDVIKSEFELRNVPFGEMGPAAANGKGTTERISGGMLKSSQATGDSATPEPKKEKDIDETVKDFEKLDGLFTLYRKRESNRDTIYLELREDQLDRLFLLQATAATGNSREVVSGTPINDLVLKFSQIDERIMLVRPNLGFRAEPGTPTARALERSFADSYLEAFKIEARQESRKSLLINVSDLFRGDIAQINAMMAGGGGPLAALLGGGGGFSPDRDKTFIVAMKAFPENIFVQTSYSYNKAGSAMSLADLLGGGSVQADPRNVVFRVNYNVSMLPDSGYVPRRFDARVGYFTEDYQDFSKPAQFDNKVRNILRWRLEKKDPNATLSEPRKPIVFWLDNAIPVEYRDAVKEGILLWNRAFEQAGFKNAVVVQQMPDDADWDPSDMRYNVVRWVLSPADAYAVAWFRSNPVTGEILNASILVDANMVRFTQRELDAIVEPNALFTPPKTASQHIHDPRRCSLQHEIQHQAAFGKLALEMVAGNVDAKEFMHSFIRHVVCHEMGHILGLRHNFVSSTQLTFEQMGDAKRVREKGTAASVMEYTPFNLAALKKPGVDYWPAGVGDYDVWAIQYGYMDTRARKPEDEVETLKRIAALCNKNGHAYQSDETADSIDPRITRFDLAANPLDYWAKMLDVTRYMGKTIGQRLPRHGESFWNLTRDFNSIISMMGRAASQCTRFIGASHLNANFKGDPGQKPPIVPANAADQKRALDLLNQFVFSQDAFNFPKETYQNFGLNPNADLLESVLSGTTDFPVLDQFSGIQIGALNTLYRPDVLRRVVNNEFKSPTPQLRLTTLFDSVRASVWSELGSGSNTTALRRRLQRAHLDRLIAMVVNLNDASPAEAKMLAWHQLGILKGQIAQASKSKTLDEYSKVHLAESAMRVQRALDARQTIGAAAGGAPMNPLQQLLGGADGG